MKKQGGQMSVLELPVYPEQWQIDKINKKYENCARIYNATRRHLLTAYQELTKTKSYQADAERIGLLRDLTEPEGKVMDFHRTRCKGFQLEKEENAKKREDGVAAYEALKEQNLPDIEYLEKLRTIPLSGELFLAEWSEIRTRQTKEQVKEYKEELKSLYQKRSEQLKELGLTEYGVVSHAAKYGRYYAASVPSSMCNYSVAKPLWRAFHALLYGNGDTVKYKRYEDMTSIATDGRTGMSLVKEEDGYFLLLRNKNKAKKMKIRVKTPNTDYEKAMIERPIKVIRLHRRMEHTTYHYYMQVTVEGSPYLKTNQDGQPRHKAGSGVVSLSIWRDTLYAVSDQEVRRFTLSVEQEAYEQQRDELTRRMEALRRENNPQNFNEDGTIKQGIFVDGVKQRLQWHNSVAYKELRVKKRELERMHKVHKDLHHRNIAYAVLEMGDTVVFSKTSFKTNKPEWDGEETKLTNEEYKKKRERRVSIMASAPYDLKQKINGKLQCFNLPAIIELQIPDSLYWYRFDTDSQDKEALNGEYVTLLGRTVPHTAYRAFITRYYNPATKMYDKKQIAAHWDNFVDMVEKLQ